MSELDSGPYYPPKGCRVGTVLHDEMLGDVKVVRIQKAPRRWPLCTAPRRPGRNPLQEIPVLCGDLVRAICEEPREAIAESWGVPISLVNQWRKAVAGSEANVQTVLLLKRHQPAFRSRFYTQR